MQFSQTALALIATTTTCKLPTPTCFTSSVSIPTPTATSGCFGKSHSDQANSTLSTLYTIDNGPDDTQRQFLVHVPSNYNSSKQTGVVLSFHGNYMNMCEQEGLSLFSDNDYNKDWIAVYPQGLDCSWVGPKYHTAANDDLLFVSNILDTLRGEFCIDDNQIYATGKSNGGGFVGTIACDSTVGANFAAFAPVSGAFYTDNDTPDESWPCENLNRAQIPMVEFHGAADNIINYNGYPPSGCKKSGCLPAIPNWLDRWAVRNNCSSPLQNTTTYPPEYDGEVIQTNFTCAGNENVVVGYEILGWKHWWPTTNPNGNSESHGYSTTIDATEVIMRFFQAWKKSGSSAPKKVETEL